MDEITYKWAITGLKKLNSSSTDVNDIIVQTYWTCTGIDKEGTEGEFSGATPFDPEQVDPDNFTDYANLSEEQIIGWIKDEVNKIGDTYWSHITDQIKSQIKSKRQVVEQLNEEDLPWKAKENIT